MDDVLFRDLRPVPLETPPTVAGDVGPSPAGIDDRQLPLFSDAAVLRRDLDHAVATGDLDQALSLYRDAIETFGSGGVGGAYGFLNALGPETWALPAGTAMERWVEVDRSMAPRPILRRGIRDGVFRRLLERHAAATLAVERPDIIGPLCAALVSLHAPSGELSARVLIRDLLLEARELDPSQFPHDTAVADLLGEHLTPVWQACLGALRRLWPVPPMSAADLACLDARPFVAPPADEAAAQEFWNCLRVARTREVPETLLHEVRRRMKSLNPEMHALHMRMANTAREQRA